MSCLSLNEFTSFDSYHNNIGINIINELVTDLHRHEDFIGVDRSEILGSTEDDITTELTNFNFGKTAIVYALSLIANTLLALIDVEVDEYAWCDEDENEYSGPRSIAGYPDGVFDHWQWPTIINGIINILQSLLCTCLVEDDGIIILPPGEDIIFRTGNLLELSFEDGQSTLKYSSSGQTNAEAFAALQDGVCDPDFDNFAPFYAMASQGSFGLSFPNCHESEGFWNYRLGTKNGFQFPVYWAGAQPGDIPFEFVRSQFDVISEMTAILGHGSFPLENNDLSMNIKIKINNNVIFSGEISVHDPIFFPEGPPTERGLFVGQRITNGYWGGSLISPGAILLHSGQDVFSSYIDVSSLSLLEPPYVTEPVQLPIKSLKLKSFELWIKARRPF